MMCTICAVSIDGALLAAGTKERVCSSNSEIMIHQPRGTGSTGYCNTWNIFETKDKLNKLLINDRTKIETIERYDRDNYCLQKLL